MTSMCRAQQTPMKMTTRNTALGRLPPKTKAFFAFRKKWIQRTERSLWARVECLDAETHMYACEYC